MKKSTKIILAKVVGQLALIEAGVEVTPAGIAKLRQEVKDCIELHINEYEVLAVSKREFSIEGYNVEHWTDEQMEEAAANIRNGLTQSKAYQDAIMAVAQSEGIEYDMELANLDDEQYYIQYINKHLWMKDKDYQRKVQKEFDDTHAIDDPEPLFLWFYNKHSNGEI